MPPLISDMRPRFAPQPGPPPELWSPPPDPEKPACPYRPGFAVEIKRHIPPPPFGDPHHGPGTWQERSDVDLHKVTQTRIVMEYPPLEHPHASPSPPAPAAPTAKLTILSPLAVEDGRGPQLVVCSVAPHASPGPGPTSLGQGGLLPAPYQAVAKIFDPLYYSERTGRPHTSPSLLPGRPMSTIRTKPLRSTTSRTRPKPAAAPDCLPPSTLAPGPSPYPSPTPDGRRSGPSA